MGVGRGVGVVIRTRFEDGEFFLEVAREEGEEGDGREEDIGYEGGGYCCESCC